MTALQARTVSLRWKQTSLRWTVPLLILVFWEAASLAGWIPKRVLPAPSETIASFWKLTLSGELPRHFLVSLSRAGAGIAVGASAGFLLGLLVGTRRLADILLDSTVQMIRTIPNLALTPLVITWFGIGEAGKVFLIALSTFFPVYVNTVHGIRSVDPKLLEMASVYGFKWTTVLGHVVLPGALPSILVGLRQSLGIAWIALVVSESIAARSGIGYLAMDAREFMRTDVVVLVIFIYAAMGKLSDSLVQVLERRLIPWRSSRSPA